MKNPRLPRPGPLSDPPSESAIEELNGEGFGICRIDGREVWIPGAFPGERVRWKARHVTGEMIVADRLEVLEASPDRVVSPCSCATACTGCPLIELDYRSQLRFKQERVERALGKRRGQRLEILPIQPAEPVLGYRTTAKLSVDYDRGGARVGLFRWGTHEVIDTSHCPVHHPLVNAVVLGVREELDRSLSRLRSTSGTVLRHVVARVSPVFGKAMLTLVVSREDDRFIKSIGKGVQRRVPELVSIHNNLNDRAGSQVFGRQTRLLWGHPDLLDQVGPHRLRLSPVSFFQAHHGQAAWIYALIRRWAALTKSDTALDLYSGVGGIAMSLAQDAGRVVGIEVSESAARDARRNAELNGLTNCAFRPADVTRLENVIRPGESPAVVCLNPPRSGAAPAVLSTLAKLGPTRMIYVSCDPDTLARDLLRLGSFGYHAVQAQPVDMFPHTAHVETVVLLDRR